MAYTERDRFYDEVKAVSDAIARGELPYGGYEGALDFLYQNYGVPAGISFQEAQQALDEPFKVNALVGAPGEVENIQQTYDQTASGATGPTQAELDMAREAYERTLAAIGRQKEDQLLGYEEQLQGLGQTETRLGEQYQQGLMSNQGYFNRISPDVYQSSLENYNKQVLDAYNQGLSTVSKNREKIARSKENYLKDIDDQIFNVNADYQANKAGYGGTAALDTSQYQTSLDQVINPYLQSIQYQYQPTQQMGGMSTQQAAGGGAWDWLKDAGRTFKESTNTVADYLRGLV